MRYVRARAGPQHQKRSDHDGPTDLLVLTAVVRLPDLAGRHQDEQARLREELRLLKVDYADRLPLRALTVALKVVRSRRALEAHPKEPLALEHQLFLETLVAEHLDVLDAERAGIAAGL
jgi:hypothetical protein